MSHVHAAASKICICELMPFQALQDVNAWAVRWCKPGLTDCLCHSICTMTAAWKYSSSEANVSKALATCTVQDDQNKVAKCTECMLRAVHCMGQASCRHAAKDTWLCTHLQSQYSILDIINMGQQQRLLLQLFFTSDTTPLLLIVTQYSIQSKQQTPF